MGDLVFVSLSRYYQFVPFLLFLVVDQLFLNSFPISLSSKIFGTRLIRRNLILEIEKSDETERLLIGSHLWTHRSSLLLFILVLDDGTVLFCQFTFPWRE